MLQPVKPRYLIYSPRRMRCARYGVGLSHGTLTGGPVLRGEASWKTVNGVWINWPTGSAWVLFRRPSL